MKQTMTAALATLMLSGGLALAQTIPPSSAPPPVAAPAPQPDPRLAGATIEALQAVLKLRESELQALTADSRKAIAKATADGEARAATLIEWLKAAQAEHGAPAAPPPDAK